MPFPFATLVPIAGAITRELVQGINNRKARLYNSPANQIKRLREAGLPTAAGSNITGGQQVPTQVSGNFGTEGFNDNLGKSITRQIDRKKLAIAAEELTSAEAKAALDKESAKIQLNPRGIFGNTNLGLGAMQTQQLQGTALKQSQILNDWLPAEKAQGILKNTFEINKIAADTANSLAQNKILISEGKIKSILAEWQPKMSSAEFTNLVRRNTGLKNQNDISAITGEILRETKIAQITQARQQALAAQETTKALQLNNLLKGLETESAKAYYKVRGRVDQSYSGSLFGDLINPRDIIYLNMFTPAGSSMNLGTFSNIFK